MKKSLLLLFSLLIFVGNVWGDYTFTYPNTVEVAVKGSSSVSLGSTYAISGVTCQVHSAKEATNSFDIGTTSGGKNIYSGTPSVEEQGDCKTYITIFGKKICTEYYYNEVWDNVSTSFSPSTSASAIYFKNNASTLGKIRYCRDLRLTIKTTTLESFGNVEAGTTSSVTRSFNVLSTSTPSIYCPTGFSATVQKGSGYSYTVTVSFSPTAVQPYSGNIKMGGQDVATVSGVGTPTIPSNLNATEEFLQSTLSWSGTNNSYYQVYNGSTLLYEGKNNSYPWTGRQWGTSYTFSVKACTAKDTNCSDAASKTFSTKTLLAPAGVSVSNIDYDNAEVTWNAAEGASLYRVYLSSDNGSTYTKYGSDVMATSERKMPISGLTPGKKYYVKVESVLNGKETSRTDSKDFTTTSINVPQNVTCTPDYLSATLSWTEVADIDKYDYYVIYDKDGHQVGKSETNSYQINGLQWGVNSGSYTVKVHAFNTESAASAGCNVTTKTLLAPEITGKTAGFDNATVTWNAATGATSYVLYLGSTKIDEVEASVTSYTFENLELDTNYSIKVESKLNDKETSSAVAQSVKTGNLNASASFTISDASYTTCHGSWSAIPNATGYKVVASNGAVTIFDGGNTTSGIIAGLLPNNTYTCTIYGMYNNAVSKNGKESNEISTLETNCESQSYTGSVTMGDATWGGFNWDAKPSATFQTTKNQATVTFSYETSSKVATHKNTDYFFTLEESKDGTKNSWRRVGDWSSSSRKSSSSVTLSRGYQYFRFVYYGNFAATIYGVSAVQAVYMEVDKTNINFGNLVYGNSASATINVAYSTMVSEITTTNSNYTLSPASVGYDDCRYGTIPVEVTFNANGTAPLGEQNTLIYIGSNPINVYATVTLPVPVLSLVSASYQSVDLSWEAIPGAEKYKVNCSNGTSAWINSSDFTGTYRYSGLLQNTNYSFTVQAYGGEELTDESNTVSAKTLSLAVPTLEASNISYTTATLSWNSITDSKGGYELINGNGNSVFVGQNVTSVNIDTLEIHKQYTYKIYSLLEDGTRSLNYGSVTFTTADLAVSTSLELSNVSYNSMDATWDAVPDAQGYMIHERWTGMELTFNADVNSTTIYGLKPGTLYEFYLYATYNEVPATDRVSASATTKSSSCPVQEVADHTFGCDNISDCGFDWSEKVYEITTDKNAPIVSFAYEINKYATKSYEEMTQYGPHVRVEAKEGNNWVEKWRFTRSQGTRSGSTKIENLNRATRQIRIIYKGNLDCKIKGCTIAQDSYMELDKTSVAFGECMIGTTATQTLGAAYSSQAISVVPSETDMFTASKDELGDGNCGYGDDSVIITANTSVEPGTYTAELVAGTKHLPMSITVLGLPAPENFVISEQNPTSTVLTWDDVNITETGYKVVCKQGDNVIETKDLGANVTTCTFTGLQSNVEYTYTITTMYNSIENGSATITGSTTQLPAPQNFNITNVLSARADASWNEVSGATGYRLTWTDGADSNGSVDLDSDVFNYVITDLIPNREYTATVATIYNGDVHGTSDEQTFTTSCVVRTAASGDEVEYQSHNIEFISGTQLADGSYLKGSVIRYTSSTSSENIRFVQINVDGTIYTTPSIEITINGNVHIESRYEYKGIAEVIDDKVYDTLNEAVEAVHDGGTINLLGDVPTQDLSVSGKHIEFNGNGHSISNLYIESDGSVDLIGDVVVVNDFGLEISTSNSGQFTQTNAQIEVRGKAYVDKAFDASGVGSADKWYSLAVPFRVSMANGMAKIVNGVESHAGQGKDIDIFVYDSEKRARTTGKLDSWVYMSANGTLEPATFYLVGITHSGPNVFRFYKDDNADLVTLNKEIELHEYPSSIQKNAGWNGIGNSQLYHVGITLASTGYAQILENNKFITIDLGESSFAVTSPMFIQSATDSKATLNYKNDGSLRSASATSATYNVRLTPEGADKYSDQMFVNASSDVTGEYRIGKDLAKFELSTSAPQIYTKAYETTLSVHEAGYNAEGYADIDLFMFAPTAGNYTLSLGKDVSDGSTLYLVKDGSAIHNFNEDGAYILYLAKGTNSSYTLRIANGTEDVPTEVTEDTESAVKVFIKEHVLHICGLPSGEDYMVGNLTRTLYTGTSNGSTIEIPLTMQGVYWIRLEDSTIKVLNK